MSTTVSRRHFVGGLAAALGYIGTTGGVPAKAQAARTARRRPRLPLEEYDAAAKLAYNENPYGPPESVVKAMTDAFRFDNRYNYPDGDILDAIAAHHGVEPGQVLLGAGSS
jgi:histidinol-phosphate aminotransferase